MYCSVVLYMRIEPIVFGVGPVGHGIALIAVVFTLVVAVSVVGIFLVVVTVQSIQLMQSPFLCLFMSLLAACCSCNWYPVFTAVYVSCLVAVLFFVLLLLFVCSFDPYCFWCCYF